MKIGENKMKLKSIEGFLYWRSSKINILPVVIVIPRNISSAFYE
jgi:hypothetical protein